MPRAASVVALSALKATIQARAGLLVGGRSAVVISASRGVERDKLGLPLLRPATAQSASWRPSLIGFQFVREGLLQARPCRAERRRSVPPVGHFFQQQGKGAVGVAFIDPAVRFDFGIHVLPQPEHEPVSLRIPGSPCIYPGLIDGVCKPRKYREIN